MVLPWRLNIDSQTEIRTEGLFAALNDCLYRNMNDFRYLMLIDFDEFIVPHTNDTLPQMLAHVDAQKIIVTGNIGRYVCTFVLCTLVAVGSSGILKAKQKLGVTFNFDKVGGIGFTKFSKLTMCRSGAGRYSPC